MEKTGVATGFSKVTEKIRCGAKHLMAWRLGTYTLSRGIISEAAKALAGRHRACFRRYIDPSRRDSSMINWGSLLSTRYSGRAKLTTAVSVLSAKF
jgi:hypothetical protein